MKKATIIMFFATIAILSSCDHSANPSNGSLNATQVVTSGSWRITLFTDSGNDETSDFNGYNFVFSTDGTIVATKNGIAKNGTWSVNESSNKLIIDLGIKDDSNKPLGELTDDWLIISKSNTEIKSTDDNPASAELLTFTRN
jgi:hypothetical protein